MRGQPGRTACFGRPMGRGRRKTSQTNRSAQERFAILSSLLPSEVKNRSGSGGSAIRLADLRVDRNIAYADSFALDLAMESNKHVLVTADYGFKAVDDLARIEFLPAK